MDTPGILFSQSELLDELLDKVIISGGIRDHEIMDYIQMKLEWDCYTIQGR